MVPSAAMSFFLVVVVLSVSAFAETDAHSIMARNEEARQINELAAKAKLVQVDPDGSSKTKEFSWARKLSSNGKDYSTFVRFHAPATIRGEGILLLEHEGADNEVLLYLPTYKKIRRVENQQQTGKFMGSVFSYSDMAAPHLSDYKYSKKATEACPTAEAAAIQCAVIESTPARESVRERTGYSRTVSWIRSDNFMAVKTDYFDLGGQPIKRLEASSIQMVDRTKKRWMSLKMKMTHLKNGESSLLEFADLKVNSGIPDRTFTQQNLSRTD